MNVRVFLSFLPLVLLARPAAAQAPAPPPPAVEAPAPPAPPAPPIPPTAPVPPAPPTPPEPPPFHPTASEVQLSVPWTGPTGKGVSFGLEEGGWSGVWGNGVRVHLPLVTGYGGSGFGVTLRGLFLFGSDTTTPSQSPADHVGGRFEFTGQSPVYLNLVRLYGGGGLDVFSGVGKGVTPKGVVTGGGEFGFEFFLARWYSMYLEVGGYGGVDNGAPGGETVIAGVNFYPFSK